MKPNITLKLGIKNYRKLNDAFQKWNEEAGNKLPTPSFGIVADLRVLDGSIRVFFVKGKEFQIMDKAAKRCVKLRNS